MGNPLFMVEDIETTPRHRVFLLFGVPAKITPFGWLGTAQPFMGGIVLGALLSIGQSAGVVLGNALLTGMLVVISVYLHSIGHIIGGKLVGAPMDELLLTMTRQVNIYHGPQEFPSRVHLARAMGGPIANIVFGITLLVGWLTVGGIPLAVLGVGNILGGLAAALLPIPSVDGEILYRELAKMRQSAKSEKPI